MADLAGFDRDCRAGSRTSEPWAVAQVQTIASSRCNPVATKATRSPKRRRHFNLGHARLLTEQIDELALLWRS